MGTHRSGRDITALPQKIRPHRRSRSARPNPAWPPTRPQLRPTRTKMVRVTSAQVEVHIASKNGGHSRSNPKSSKTPIFTSIFHVFFCYQKGPVTHNSIIIIIINIIPEPQTRNSLKLPLNMKFNGEWIWWFPRISVETSLRFTWSISFESPKKLCGRIEWLRVSVQLCDSAVARLRRRKTLK